MGNPFIMALVVVGALVLIASIASFIAARINSRRIDVTDVCVLTKLGNTDRKIRSIEMIRTNSLASNFKPKD